MKNPNNRRFTVLKGKPLRADATASLLAIAEALTLADDDMPPQVLNALRMAQRTLIDLRQPQLRPNASVISAPEFRTWYAQFLKASKNKTTAVKFTAAKLGVSVTAVWDRLRRLGID